MIQKRSRSAKRQKGIGYGGGFYAQPDKIGVDLIVIDHDDMIFFSGGHCGFSSVGVVNYGGPQKEPGFHYGGITHLPSTITLTS